MVDELDPRLLRYLGRLDSRLYKAADLAAFPDDALEWHESDATCGLADWLAAKCTLRDLQIEDEVEIDDDGRFWIGPDALIQCAIRKQAATGLAWALVYEGDIFEFEDGTSPRLRHITNPNNRGGIAAAWATGRKLGLTADGIYVAFRDEIPRIDSPDGLCERAIRGLLGRISGSRAVAHACRLNDQYISALPQAHEYTFPELGEAVA